ncbi:UbiX family flavin prenyltransferase [Candidatus Aerophobetes bacterium]|nr:UbiX family flavin prenyltransferase [Candidatus Aerophobetes bacterium]
MQKEKIRRIIVALSGASGAIYGIRLLEALQRIKIETHLIISRWAEVTIKMETGYLVEEVQKLATYSYSPDNLTAPCASGSFLTEGMVIVPCSMKTLAAIACGYVDNLVSRAADITMKEGRKLILVPREAPFNAIHLENMLKLCRLGVVIIPPVPAFYIKPSTIDDLINHTVGKVLDGLGIDNELYERWK